MLKKILSMFLCVVTVFASSSCEEEASGDPNETSSQIASEQDTSSGAKSVTSYEKIFPTTVEPKDETVFKNWISQRTETEDINAGDYDDIITKIYSPADVDGASLLLTKWFYYYVSDSEMTYKPPVDEKGFECYRTAVNNIYYTVTKLDNGTLIYTYYTSMVTQFVPSFAIAVSKKLSSKDFEDITVGDKLDKIYEIEPAANLSNYTGGTTKPEEFENIRGERLNSRKVLLTDGVLELKYELNENGERIITEKILHSDFKCLYVISEKDSIAAELDYTILEKDYPKN